VRSGVGHVEQSVSPYAVAIWLREAEREVEGIELPTYDPVRLRGLVPQIRSLTTALVLSMAVEEARGRTPEECRGRT
jgi:hypothetical protein